MKAKDSEWRHFEIAVAKFIGALGSGARVTHDVKIPDAHTGRPRQRDVWVETKLFGHYPVKILVSCKRWSKVLDEKDIDHFNGEYISSNADLGIIYSLLGFNGPATEKARKLRFHCCQLFEDEAPAIPECLLFTCYLLSPTASLTLVEPLDPAWGATKWQDLFELNFTAAESGHTTILDCLVAQYEVQHDALLSAISSNVQPRVWAIECNFSHNGRKPLRVHLAGGWKVYRGNVEANLLNGSYNATSGEFVGRQIGPVIDTWSAHPGPGWTLIDGSIDWPTRMTIMIVKKPDLHGTFKEFFGQLSISA